MDRPPTARDRPAAPALPSGSLPPLLLVLLLAACAAPPAPPAEPDPPPRAPDGVAYQCGDRTATLAMDVTGPQLVVDGARRPLRPVMAATGARYEAEGDVGTTFWSLGATARITWDGAAWPACVPLLPTPARLQADGPGWRLDLLGPRASLRDANGEPLAEGHARAPSHTAHATTWTALTATDAFVVTALARPCPGPVPRPFTVQVAWGGRVLDGCGGDTADLLTGSVWVVTGPDGAALHDGVRTTLHFTSDGGVAGAAPCNAYTGAYTVGPDGLRVTRSATTRRLCEPAVMREEAEFLRALDAARGLAVAPDGGLLVMGADGPLLRLRRE